MRGVNGFVGILFKFWWELCLIFWVCACTGLFCIVRWAGLRSTVMGLSILGKGVETNSVATQLGLACAQTMPRLPGVCLWQAELLPMSYGRRI